MGYAGGSIMGIDQATTTGIACGVPGEDPRLETLALRHDETDAPEDIFARATYWMAERLRTAPPGLIAIEAPMPPRDFNAALISIGLFGIFCGIAKCKGISVIRAPSNSWRLYFLGNGRLAGDVAKRRCVQLCNQLGWHVPGGDHNAAEAAGIFAWACAQVAPRLAPRIEPLFARATSASRKGRPS